MHRLGPILRDRAYRAHLARQVLQVLCPSRCPESPGEHAADPNLEAAAGGELGYGDELDYHYQDFITFAFKQFRRPWNEHYVTAFEVVAGHHKVDAINYCSKCLKKADEKYELNELIRLCASCLEMRDTHVQHTFQKLQDNHEPWEQLEVTSVSPFEVLEGYEGRGYDELVEHCILLRHHAFGSNGTIIAGVVMTALTGIPAVIAAIYFGIKTKGTMTGHTMRLSSKILPRDSTTTGHTKRRSGRMLRHNSTTSGHTMRQ